MVKVGETAICAICGQPEVYSQAMQDFTFELFPDLPFGEGQYSCRDCTKWSLCLGLQIYVKVAKSRGVHRLLLEKNLSSVFGIGVVRGVIRPVEVVSNSANEEPSAEPNPAGGKEA